MVNLIIKSKKDLLNIKNLFRNKEKNYLYNVLKVQYTKGTKDKSKEDQKMIKVLMGDEVAPRKDFITNNALDVANLDI